MFVPLKPKLPTISFLPPHIKSIFRYRMQLWNDKNRNLEKLKKCTTKINKEINKFIKHKERKRLSKISTKFRYIGAFLKPKSKIIPTLEHNAKLIFTDVDKCNALSDTFESIFNKNKLKTNDIIPNSNRKTLDFINFTQQDVLIFLNNLRTVTNSSPDHVPEIFLLKCSESLYYPLTLIFQFSMMSSVVPDLWKKSIVVPIPKTTKSSNPLDYRPISLLCPISKIFEKIIFTQITDFLENNNIIPKCQHGFIRKKSVVTSLIETFEDLSIAHENNLATDVIYIDLSKAFDSVPINRLISKLSSFGICSPLLDLIQYYLTNRTYTVRVGNAYSNNKPIPSGVPQGSVCGPILFIAYISDLPTYCKVSGVTTKLFADDLKCYSSSTSPDIIGTLLYDFIGKFTEYCYINGLSINPNKCNVLHLGKKNKNLPYAISGIPINSVENNQPIRDLGLHFTSDLKWQKHIEIICKKATRTSFALLKSIKYSNSEMLVNLFKVYVRPILEFATNVFNPFLVKDITKLEKVQKDFLRFIYKRSHPNIYKQNPLTPTPSYIELLFIHNLESLELRRLKSDLIMFHKHLHGDAKINCYNSYKISETRTRGDKYKIIPNVCSTIIRHNSFFVRTSRIYSKLPQETRHCDLKLFKTKLSTPHILDQFLKCNK